MGIFSRRTKSSSDGEVNIATPAMHLTQLDSEESLGLNILKGFSGGKLTFGDRQEIFERLIVRSWGYENPFFPSGRSAVREEVYILCWDWNAFCVDKELAPGWVAWLSHYYPKNH